ncbi:MAG: threonine/serine dehydratase [Xanthomonadales bacterium]|nr:threonine/serine dehydratase [Gammaproteobacteria bacterium]NNL94692.1 threonine/serine dehydratase [Xanthomonadales bacterium]
MSADSEMIRPEYTDIAAAAQRIKGHVQRTPVVESETLNSQLGCQAWFKCENRQATGAFKLRGASNAVLKLVELGILQDVATHSSGNHGAALACAASSSNRKAYVVMPDNAVRAKVDSVRRHGGEVIFCAANQSAREAGLAELVRKGLVPIPPYDHPDIIAGQGTAALEFIQEVPRLDYLVTPVGGGGLVSGSAIAARHADPKIRVIAAEPAGAADTFKSFSQGKRVDSWNPDTIADGLRAVVGEMTFPIIRELVYDVLTVSEEGIRQAVYLAYEHLGMVIEPSAATVIAAIMQHPDRFTGQRVGMILSGGNIDPGLFPDLAHSSGG